MALLLRRDTSTGWATVNPVLSAGEPGYELDTQILKIGDGLTPYNNLPQYGGLNNATAGGRLSVTPNVPVPDPWGATTWTTSASTIWYVPYMSDKITLWSGTAWQQYTFDNTTKLVISGLAASKVFDIFAYQVNGTVTLSAVQWTNNVARSVALVLLNGVLVRNGMANMRYLGTIRTNTVAGTTSDLLSKRFVYNYYNQVQRPLLLPATTPHTYSSSAWRIWNNNLGESACAQFVTGVRQPIPVQAHAQIRYGYFALRFMCGVPYTTITTTAAAAGATTLALAVVDDNIAPNHTTLSGVGLSTDPRPVVTAVNGNVVTLNRPLAADIPAGSTVIVGPWTSTVDAAGNVILPTALGGSSFITVTTAGILAAAAGAGFGSIVPCEYGISADSFFTSGTITAIMMA